MGGFMFTYENGLIVAWLMWLANIIISIIRANSMMQKNLKKIGKRIGYLGIVDIENERKSPYKRFLIFFTLNILIPFPFIFFSWITVFLGVAIYIYSFNKDIGAPQNIKEFRWKLKNIDMTFDQIIRELMILDKRDPEDFEDVKKELQDYLSKKSL